MRKNSLKIFLLVIFSLLMPTIAGVVIGVGGITDENAIYLIQFACIFTGLLILLLVLKFSSFSFKEMGFTGCKIDKWVIGIILIEAIAVAFGFHHKMSAATILLLIVFMAAVGGFEELVYRGFVLKYLSSKSGKAAVFISAALFGTGHIVNLLGGADFGTTIVQIIFAFLFGVVCAEIVLLTKSITFVICWHGIHNIISRLNDHSPISMNMQLLMVGAQCVILAVLAYSLWKKLFK